MRNPDFHARSLVPFQFVTLFFPPPGLPTDSTAAGEQRCVGMRFRSATHRIPTNAEGEGGHASVGFLGFLVSVTGTGFLHLSDPDEASDCKRSCRDNKREKKA